MKWQKNNAFESHLLDTTAYNTEGMPEAVINKLTINDLEAFEHLLTVFDIVFEYPPYPRPDEDHLRGLLGSSSFFCIIASIGHEVIGGLTAYALQQYHAMQPVLYIYDLAVLPAYQRKGIGSMLIRSTNDYARLHGFSEVYVQAEKADDYALDFYRSTNPASEDQVVQFYYRHT